jgi:hypothetical protein
MKPLASCPRAVLANIRGVFTDIDETVSTAGHLTAEAYGTLAALKKAGLLVVPVTGRPAGWCDHIARFWPVDAVVGENGAFWMWHDLKVGRLRTRFIQSDAERADGRRRLEAVRADVLREVTGTALASDQPYRLADLAIDFCEDVPALPRLEVERIVAIRTTTRRCSASFPTPWVSPMSATSPTPCRTGRTGLRRPALAQASWSWRRR